MVWEKQNTISAAENKCNASFCRLELLPFLSHSRPQTDFPQTGAPGMELLNAPGISCLCMAIGHQISNSNNDQWQRGREISTPNSLTKITWSACSTHVPLTEARPYFHFGTMFYILCQHISGSPWKGENQQVKFSCLPLPFTPSPSPSLSLPPPSTLPVCLGIIASLKADSRRDSPAVSEFLIDSTSLGKEPTCQWGRHKRRGFDPWVRRSSGGGCGNHTSVLAWRIPWTEEPGRLQSIGLQRVGHDWNDLACMHVCRAEMCWLSWNL